ncbi:MAG: Ldh family oxidoreductase [Chloroflexi bacterium]|nr:Ldh family oxidoreductase [Chloroflexota bacterium]
MLERFKVPEKDRVYVRQERVRAATEAIFRKMGLDEAGARQSTDVLITNDLRAVETHGVSNMLRRYVQQYSDGSQNPRPRVRATRETGTTATLDGDGGLGIHVGPDAMRLAIAKAKQHGMGAVSMFNSGHLGGCGYHAMLAAEDDMIGLCMTGGGGASMVPTFGAEPRLGTNPIAWAAPARKQPPFLFDVASTQIANNKIGLARRLGVKLEPGWITRPDGTPVLEETSVPEKYYMLPFGGTRENGSHKGYGFGAVVDIMCATLSGVGPGFISKKGGHFFCAFRIDAFTDPEKFKDDMDAFLAGLAATKPAPGHERVLYPGLTEGEETAKRMRDGIPYHREVVEWYQSIGAELGIPIEIP